MIKQSGAVSDHVTGALQGRGDESRVGTEGLVSSPCALRQTQSPRVGSGLWESRSSFRCGYLAVICIKSKYYLLEQF